MGTGLSTGAELIQYGDSCRSAFPFIRPRILGVIRVLIGLYITSIIAAAVAIDEQQNNIRWWRFWSFLTNWSYTVAAAYFLAHVNSADPFNKKLQEKGSAWDMFMWILFETCFVTAFIVFLLFWAVLVGLSGCVSRGTCNFDFYSWNAHGVNFAWMVLDLVLNKFSFATLHVWFSMLFISVYQCFTVVYRVSGSNWPYSAQDINSGGLLSYIFYPGLLAAYVGVFFIALGIEKLLSICTPTRHYIDGENSAEFVSDSASSSKSSSESS